MVSCGTFGGAYLLTPAQLFVACNINGSPVYYYVFYCMAMAHFGYPFVC